MPHRGKRSKEARIRRAEEWFLRHGYPKVELKRYASTENLSRKQIKPLSSKACNPTLQPKAQHALKIIVGKCQICGWNVYPACLEVHHKDKNRRNNTRANLVVLCRNCHSLVHHKEGYANWLIKEA